MNRIATSVRPYQSELRAQQAEETRNRILDATLRVMAGGVATMSVPAVAREAGVSVPTVYRHFGTKADLLAALYPHAVRRAGADGLTDPHSLDGLRDFVRAMFGRLESAGDLARAAMASPAADEARQVTMPNRLERIQRFADAVAPNLPDDDRDRITRLVAVLISSSALRMWRDHLGSSIDEAADDIDWVVRAALAAATSSDAR